MMNIKNLMPKKYTMIKTILSILLFLTVTIFVSAQNKLTLKDAIESGIKNNLEVNQADLQMQKQGITFKQTKAFMLPDLNAIANHGINQGRSIDPFTNNFITQRVDYANYGASTNILLFNGSSLRNKIKQNALAYEASKMEWQQAKDNLTINIILAYLQVLSAEDILEQARKQAIVTGKQAERLDVLNKEGAVSPSEFYDVKGQLANEQIAITDNETAVANAKLTLLQLLNMPYDKEMEVERLPEENFNINYTETPENIYAASLQNFAQIKSVRLRTQSAEKAIASAKGELFPTLSLGGNLNTNYSSVATQSLLINTTDVPSSNYVIINGSQVPVITKQNNYSLKHINFGNQLSNNLFSTINISLRIPIFSALQTKNKIRLAKIDFENNELIEQNAKTELQQSIERAYVNLSGTQTKYKLLQEQVASFNESFRAADIRFNAGAITSVDYLIAKNNLDKSKTNLIIAKYDFVLRSKVLDYYQGKAL